MAEERTLEQRRAAHALAKITELQKRGKDGYGNYKSYVSALPAAILSGGLGQAAATALSRKDRKGYLQLYEHLSGWLCGGDAESPYPRGDLLKNITEGSQDDYLRAQAEALAYLTWLKKFADAFLEGERGEE
ncbi:MULTISPECIES: type III-B CRISPR module-associated protein Cmr5 [Rubrobacter]|uniref:CRISPR type III-B/RAMP module-associated protein Cmr5 n=1 Tax=Rubrobacter xylanophilus TaxID=49319 RepID=A0A510HPP3_9ACTN|nr:MULTISPECIES: type III-B CRISPR module-associated protein Cmr5 [Rubrobacter]BBL80787.1 type III-B CRISPR module-associated protein Cmr5 [Rubrobacter xylanophilus]